MDLKKKLAAHKAKKANSTDEKNKVGSVSELLGSDGNTDVSDLVNEAKAEGRFISLEFTYFIPDPEQPRKTFDTQALKELQSDIEAIGQLQPIVVRPADDNGKYMIVVGERRWKAISASKKVSTVDAVIVESELDELLILRMQIQENNNREGVNALENAASILRGVNLCKKQDENIDDKNAATLLGVSTTIISKSRSILNAADEIKSLSEDGVTQDIDTLYELSKSHKKDANATAAFINDMRNDDIEGNIRKAAQRLDTDLKKSNATKKSASKAKKTSIPVVDDVTIENKGKKTVVNLVIGNKKQAFSLSPSVVNKIIEQLSIEQES